MLKASIIIPVVRPQNIPKLKRMIQEHAGLPTSEFELLTAEDTNRIGCPRMVKKLTDEALSMRVMFLGDDVIPWRGFLKTALKAMDTLPDGWGLVGLNDQNTDGEEFATHWMADKRLLEHLGGEFFHTGYKHCYCDQELTARAKELGRYVWAKDALIKHIHPMIDKNVESDADYDRIYSDDYKFHDQWLFEYRSKSGWKSPSTGDGKPHKIVIGIPSRNGGCRIFRNNLDYMRAFSKECGIETRVIMHLGTAIHHTRNIIVRDAKRDHPDAEAILWLDDDMTFPVDLLAKMVTHKKDLVVCNAYRKLPPYEPVVSMLHEKRFVPVHVKPSEGQLRKVHAAGTGVAFTSMKVFNDTPFPWFMFGYMKPVTEGPHDLIEGVSFVGEDTYFFSQAQNAGFDLYCDFSIEIGHIPVESMPVTWKDYEAYHG